MSERQSAQGAHIVAKAGLWYTVCNFLFRGMAFITTPIFTRLMSKADLGAFSNFASWASILLVVTSFQLSQSVIRSKLEHEDDMDCYIWSILSFSTIWTLVVYLVFCLFPGFFADLLQIEWKYVHLLFLYLLTAPAYSMLVTKHRAFYKYKTFVVLTGIMVVSGTICSLLLVILMQDKCAGRLYGYYVPHIIIGAFIFLYLIVKGKRIKIEYWKYACVICLPLVPHVLSMYLLSTSDKAIITRLCGAEYTAVYAVAYSAYHIVTILFDSMNKAFAPWLLESLHHEKYAEIRKTSKIYIGVFMALVIGVFLLIPEIILLLGGRQYENAIPCLPPLLASCVFQLIYTMYVNVEFYEKKTVGVAAGTMVAAAVNIALNFIFIPMAPERGYIIAAYTTLIGYMLLFVIHYFLVKRMKMQHVFNIYFNLAVLAGTLAVASMVSWLYAINPLLRYGFTLLYGALVLFVGLRNKERILGIFRRNKKTA